MAKKDNAGNAGNDSIEVVGDGPFVAAFIDTALRDPRLSWKAKGIAAYLLSKPKGWRIWTADLIKRSTDGRDAVLTGLAELETCGYLHRSRTNDPETGHLQWRKTITATPTTMWSEQPSTENPVMDGAPSTGLPYTVKPSTVQPSTVNPTHSSSQGSFTQGSISNSMGEESAGAAVAEADAPTAGEEDEDEQAVIARILADCSVSVTAGTLAMYGLEHVRAEAVRWWNETPAHARKKSAGLLVYRIRNRKYAALTDDERAMCDRYTFWVKFTPPADEPEDTQPPVSAPERPSSPEKAPTQSYQPGNPLSAWGALLYELTLESNSPGALETHLSSWLAKCNPTMNGDTLLVTPPDNRYRDWVSARLMPRLNRKLAVIRMRAPDAPAQIAMS